MTHPSVRFSQCKMSIRHQEASHALSLRGLATCFNGSLFSNLPHHSLCWDLFTGPLFADNQLVYFGTSRFQQRQLEEKKDHDEAATSKQTWPARYPEPWSKNRNWTKNNKSLRGHNRFELPWTTLLWLGMETRNLSPSNSTPAGWTPDLPSKLWTLHMPLWGRWRALSPGWKSRSKGFFRGYIGYMGIPWSQTP